MNTSPCPKSILGILRCFQQELKCGYNLPALSNIKQVTAFNVTPFLGRNGTIDICYFNNYGAL